ncbi:hypothetical protein AB0L75_43310 [Streptomyces sp. NPDC052101]|uniref:hypothetical protein n=1 Tax=Streptomyces sp. NPDC052101 TaxID=3155763 RepID=UPI0034461B92
MLEFIFDSTRAVSDLLLAGVLARHPDVWWGRECRHIADSGARSTHRLGPPVPRLDSERALIEAPACIKVRAEVGGVTADVTSYTRLLYRAERRHDRWWLVSLEPIYERGTIVPVSPDAVPQLDPVRLARFRPSYRALAYHLDGLGYPIDDDLFGDDRSAGVESLYTRSFAWLHG